MAHVQYQTTVDWDSTLKDVGYTDSDTIGLSFSGLVESAVKVTAGAPTATAGKFIPGAIIQNAVSGIGYINSGTTALPVWSVISVGGGGGMVIGGAVAGGIPDQILFVGTTGLLDQSSSLTYNPITANFFTGNATQSISNLVASGTTVVNASQFFRVTNNATQRFLEVAPGSAYVNIGDIDGVGNSVILHVSDSGNLIQGDVDGLFTIQSTAGNRFLQVDTVGASEYVYIGDVDGAGNGTTFILDDNAQSIQMQAKTAGVGGELQVDQTSAGLRYTTGANNWGVVGDNTGGGQLNIFGGATTYIWPAADGSNGNFLKTDGAGNLSFQTLLAFSSDAAAGVGGLVTGDTYQTNGGGIGVFADVGVVMVKQ